MQSINQFYMLLFIKYDTIDIRYKLVKIKAFVLLQFIA